MYFFFVINSVCMCVSHICHLLDIFPANHCLQAVYRWFLPEELEVTIAPNHTKPTRVLWWHPTNYHYIYHSQKSESHTAWNTLASLIFWQGSCPSILLFIVISKQLSQEVWKSNFRQYGQMEKQRWEESGRRVEERRSENRKSEKKEDAGARKGSNVAKHYVFPMTCGSKGSKSRLAKAAGAEPCGQMRDENCTPLWREARFQVKLSGSDQLWKLRYRKCARRCGAKHISKSKCIKHTRVGALLEVVMSKKWAPLWRKAHFQVKMYKAHHARSTFGTWDVENVNAVVARSTFRSQEC